MNHVSQTSYPFQVTDLTPCIGSEIKIDVPSLLSGKYTKEIRDVLERRGVIAFRSLHLDDDQQMAFTNTIGEATIQ
jgi:alpha-ketoglutarate-dependent taurine dioxygenase